LFPGLPHPQTPCKHVYSFVLILRANRYRVWPNFEWAAPRVSFPRVQPVFKYISRSVRQWNREARHAYGNRDKVIDDTYSPTSFWSVVY
jgi:hypothetical protein